MKLGQRMITELQFYELDEQWLGSESEDYEQDDDEQKDITQILKQSMGEEEVELTPMETALKVMGDDGRADEMKRAAEVEMNINEYKVEPATNQCMTDFFTMDMPGLDDVADFDCGETEYGVPPEELPLNFYDNEDGFWDDYIRHKHTRNEQAGMITNRMYFMH